MHSFEIALSLPPYGPEAICFSATGHGLHTEGLVVRFLPQDEPTWYGNFIGGLGGTNGLYRHPDQKHAVIVSNGQVYVVEPGTKALTATFGADIGSVLEVGHFLVLAGNTDCYVLEDTGERWVTRRLSWDGIQNLSAQGHIVVGEALALNDTWIPFQIDLSTRTVSGGSY